jgi:hypothetical protein
VFFWFFFLQGLILVGVSLKIILYNLPEKDSYSGSNSTSVAPRLLVSSIHQSGHDYGHGFGHGGQGYGNVFRGVSPMGDVAMAHRHLHLRGLRGGIGMSEHRFVGMHPPREVTDTITPHRSLGAAAGADDPVVAKLFTISLALSYFCMELASALHKVHAFVFACLSVCECVCVCVGVCVLRVCVACVCGVCVECVCVSERLSI